MMECVLTTMNAPESKLVSKVEAKAASAQPGSSTFSASPAPVRSRPIITVRRLAPTDSIRELTTLLHRAYAKQIAMGLSPLAGRQSEDVTRQRVFSGQAFVAVHHIPLPDVEDPNGVSVETRQKVVGTILYHEVEEAEGPPWFHRKDVAWFSQLAVDPDYQGQGIGHMLVEIVEQLGREDGAAEMGLSMAEPDTDLMAFYQKRGYRVIEFWQWPYTNYRSAIMSKALSPTLGKEGEGGVGRGGTQRKTEKEKRGLGEE
jgi:GNAT superfamily N-acetyltransferase